MYFNVQNTLVFTVLALTAVGSWYVTRTNVIDDPQEESVRGLPLGYYLIDAELLGTDEEGQVFYQISARRLEERADESGLSLRDVRVEYRPRVDVPWLLTAASGRAPRDQSYLELEGRVELVSQPDDGEEGTIIRTERLRLLPESFVATTDASVSVRVGQTQISAVGMKAYLKDDRLELESSVHAQFRP